jgi:hypothetical protein
VSSGTKSAILGFIRNENSLCGQISLYSLQQDLDTDHELFKKLMRNSILTILMKYSSKEGGQE